MPVLLMGAACHQVQVGRENLPDAVLYSSRESHYSVFKAARMYRMDAVKVCLALVGGCSHVLHGCCQVVYRRGADGGD